MVRRGNTQIGDKEIFVDTYTEPRCPKCGVFFTTGEAIIEGYHAECWGELNLTENERECLLEWVSGVV